MPPYNSSRAIALLKYFEQSRKRGSPYWTLKTQCGCSRPSRRVFGFLPPAVPCAFPCRTWNLRHARHRCGLVLPSSWRYGQKGLKDRNQCFDIQFSFIVYPHFQRLKTINESILLSRILKISKTPFTNNAAYNNERLDSRKNSFTPLVHSFVFTKFLQNLILNWDSYLLRI